MSCSPRSVHGTSFPIIEFNDVFPHMSVSVTIVGGSFAFWASVEVHELFYIFLSISIWPSSRMYILYFRHENFVIDGHRHLGENFNEYIHSSIIFLIAKMAFEPFAM